MTGAPTPFLPTGLRRVSPRVPPRGTGPMSGEAFSRGRLAFLGPRSGLRGDKEGFRSAWDSNASSARASEQRLRLRAPWNLVRSF